MIALFGVMVGLLVLNWSRNLYDMKRQMRTQEASKDFPWPIFKLKNIRYSILFFVYLVQVFTALIIGYFCIVEGGQDMKSRCLVKF